MKPKKGYHRHHIIPRYMGGTDDPENLVYLTREEHIKAHELLYEKYGNDEDRRAALILREGFGRGVELIHRENSIKGANAAHKIKLENGFYNKLGNINKHRLTGSKNPEHSKKMKEKFKTYKMLWWNNGVDQQRSPECPGDGWIRGRLNHGNMRQSLKQLYEQNPPLWWNNGEKNTRSPECPGDGWIRGRIKL